MNYNDLIKLNPNNVTEKHLLTYNNDNMCYILKEHFGVIEYLYLVITNHKNYVDISNNILNYYKNVEASTVIDLLVQITNSYIINETDKSITKFIIVLCNCGLDNDRVNYITHYLYQVLYQVNLDTIFKSETIESVPNTGFGFVEEKPFGVRDNWIYRYIETSFKQYPDLLSKFKEISKTKFALNKWNRDLFLKIRDELGSATKIIWCLYRTDISLYRLCIDMIYIHTYGDLSNHKYDIFREKIINDHNKDIKILSLKLQDAINIQSLISKNK